MRPELEFARSHLAVRYRGDPAPQVLEIHVVTDRPPEVPFGPAALTFLVEAVNLGGAGGSEFPPTAGAARIVRGPGDVAGRAHAAWQIEVAGVTPFFVRTLVERLGDPGLGAVVTSMTIAGSLPLDASLLSVTERTVLSWLDDDDARPGAWPAPGFPIRDRPIDSGACIRLRLAQPADHDRLVRFTRLIEIWNQAILSVTNSSGEYVGVADAAPRMSRSTTELASGYDAFDFYRPPVRATLVNMLTRFHEQVTPIVEAEIALA
jgi:hypothetical protein